MGQEIFIVQAQSTLYLSEEDQNRTPLRLSPFKQHKDIIFQQQLHIKKTNEKTLIWGEQYLISP